MGTIENQKKLIKYTTILKKDILYQKGELEKIMKNIEVREGNISEMVDKPGLKGEIEYPHNKL